MAEGGFIKLNRKLLGWEHHKNSAVLNVWIHLLLLADWEDKPNVKRGEVLITQELLAYTCGLSRQTIIRVLKILEDSGEIKVSTNHKRTKITIIKYQLYQNFTTGVTTDFTTGFTNEETAHPYKKKKEGKKERKKESSKEIQSFTPPTADEIREYAESEQLQLDIERFLHFNEKKGWIEHDWKYSVRSWCKKDQEFQKNRPKKNDAMPDWYSADPKRSSGSGEKLSADELKAAQEKLKQRGKAKGG